MNPLFPPNSPYRRLAAALDALPNRFPPAPDEADLRVLEALFTPEEAGLAGELLPEPETPAEIASRLGRDPRELMSSLKEMSRKGLITFGKTAQGRPGFAMMPFIVGFYEAQAGRLTPDVARKVEDYFHSAFGEALRVQPQVHRVIPVEVSIKTGLEVQPYESVAGLLERAQSWGVIDCICRTQKTLIGQPCQHPIDVCLVLSQKPDEFAGSQTVRALTLPEAHQTLERAATAGLVHCVSNQQNDLWYVCNCCTCSCGILRGMAELGIANVVARSAFVNQVNEELCAGCEECLTACQFNALSVYGVAQVLEVRCVGCGVCIGVCPQGALSLRRREDADLPPATETDWKALRTR